jgi:AcrR family transcriptional regulator
MVMISKKKFNQEVKRLTILQAAKELFVEKRYSTITMDEIAAHAKTTKRTVYVYFPSKLALYIHVFDEYLQSLYQELVRGAKQDLPSNELIVSLFNILYQFTKRNEKFMRLYWTLDSAEFDGVIPEELEQRIKVWTNAMFDEMLKVLSTGQKDGELVTNYDPRLVSHLLSAMNKGIFIHTNKESKFNIASVDPDELYEIIAYLLNVGLFGKKEKKKS